MAFLLAFAHPVQASRTYYFRVVCHIATPDGGRVALSSSAEAHAAGVAPLDTTFSITTPDSVEVANATFYLHGIPRSGWGVDYFYNNDVGFKLPVSSSRWYVSFELNSSRTDPDRPATYHFTAYFRPLPDITLDGEHTTAHNADSIAAHQGYANVRLLRKLPDTDTWYTLCLPFNLSDKQLQAAFGRDYNLQEYDREADLTASQYNFCFRRTDTLVAGRPYLLKPSTPVEDYVFEGVLLSTRRTATVRLGIEGFELHGTRNFEPEDLLGGNYQDRARFFHSLRLVTPYEGHGTLCATRCFIVYPYSMEAKKAVTFSMDNGETTGFGRIDNPSAVRRADHIYNLMGQYVGNSLSALPQGLYIINGKKLRK